MSHHVSPIGVFDSGIGGFSVLRHLHTELPQENILYFADQSHIPYGPRSILEIRQFSQAITQFLLNKGAKIIVVACNTASAAALTYLRHTFPNVPFVGMEPAVKPAAHHTHTGQVGILATPTTFASERYTDLMHRFAQDIIVWEDPCVGLVELIESGQTNTPPVNQLLNKILSPMLAQNVDTIVLGCTHYPFVTPLISHIVGPQVTIIDPAPAVVRQTQYRLKQHHLLNHATTIGNTTLFTSANRDHLTNLAQKLLGRTFETEMVLWQHYTIQLKPKQ